MSSQRARERRVNQGLFISGGTGSGKSRMAERLAKKWRRVVYVDATRSFEDIDYRASTHAEAKTFLASRWTAKPFRLALTFSDDEEFNKTFAGLFNVAVQSQGLTDNVLLVVDEIDMWSTANRINTHISNLLRYGRHYGISWIAICRADVQTHRDVRTNATEVLLFRQGMLSSEMKKMILSAEEVRGESLTTPARLVRWNSDGEAIEGTHFIALPDGFDEWLPTWEALAKIREPV